MSNVFTGLLAQRRRQAPQLIELASAFDVALELIEGVEGLYLTWIDPDDDPEHPSRREVQLWCMAFNWRITEVIDEVSIGRYWCFAGTRVDTFVVAVVALRNWRGDPDSEPIGWSRASDGRTAPGDPR